MFTAASCTSRQQRPAVQVLVKERPTARGHWLTRGKKNDRVIGWPQVAFLDKVIASYGPD